ncbi:MAG: helix-turn-helix domain-containing protein [Bacteroidota bacterium]|nr:helix-turn-helix domain-containing protein [Bacteroidota bacterium]
MPLSRTAEQLQNLGFSGFEADVYLSLLIEPGITGYRVAQITGKPVPNTYKTLENLQKMGAVLVDNSGKSRMYSAIPIGEYVDIVVRGLEKSRKILEKDMDSISKPPPEEGVFRLTTVHQVYHRAEKIIRSSVSSLLVDIDPNPLSHLKDSIEKTAARGVKTLVHVHSDTMDKSIPGCEVVNSCKLDWPGEWLIVQADAKEYLIAIITSDDRRVYQAVWSRNPFIAPCIYQGYMNKALLYKVLLMIGSGKPFEEIKDELHRLWSAFGADDPGTLALQELLKNP